MEKYPIYLVRAPSDYILSSTFMRFTAYYECPRFHGKIFTAEEYMDWYVKQKGAMTYYTDWDGYNIPSAVLEPFRKGLFDPLLEKEKRLLSLFENIPEPFYVIGARKRKDLELGTLKHEFVHGLYFIDSAYRKSVNHIVGRMNPSSRKKFFDELKNRGYRHQVYRDEINSYLLTEPPLAVDREILKTKEKLRICFKTRFGFSIARAGKKAILKRVHQVKL